MKGLMYKHVRVQDIEEHHKMRMKQGKRHQPPHGYCFRQGLMCVSRPALQARTYILNRGKPIQAIAVFGRTIIPKPIFLVLPSLEVEVLLVCIAENQLICLHQRRRLKPQPAKGVELCSSAHGRGWGNTLRFAVIMADRQFLSWINIKRLHYGVYTSCMIIKKLP